MSTGIEMVYSAPAAPMRVALIVGAVPMVIWLPYWYAQAYAARRVLQSVMAEVRLFAMYKACRRPQSKEAGGREGVAGDWKTRTRISDPGILFAWRV